MEYIYVDDNNIGRIELQGLEIMNKLETQKKAFNHLPIIGRKNKIPKIFRRYKLKINKNTYISINKKSSPHKILKINNIKDFDKFNEKYCIIQPFTKSNGVSGVATLNWKKILKEYGGIFISNELLNLQYFPKDDIIDIRDRWYTLPIKSKRYYSWIDSDVYTSGNAFIIWNIGTIKKAKYLDTIVSEIFQIGLPKYY